MCKTIVFTLRLVIRIAADKQESGSRSKCKGEILHLSEYYQLVVVGHPARVSGQDIIIRVLLLYVLNNEEVVCTVSVLVSYSVVREKTNRLPVL